MKLKHSSQLSSVDQAFIDAIARNNGRDPARHQSPVVAERPRPRTSSLAQQELVTLIAPLDPDCGYGVRAPGVGGTGNLASRPHSDFGDDDAQRARTPPPHSP